MRRRRPDQRTSPATLPGRPLVPGLRTLFVTVIVALVLVPVHAQELARGASSPPRSGVGLVDPDQGLWHLRHSDGTLASFFYGNPGDFPIMGDWDCDGVDTPALYRQTDGFVYLRNSNTAGIAEQRFFFGDPGDIPLAGDFDGDDCDTVSIYRPSEGRMFVIDELGSADGGLGAAKTSYYFGNPGDKPFVGDFDGNGIDTLGLHRESTGLVYFRLTHTVGTADREFVYGDPADRLAAGDWTGDGIDSPVLFRPSDTTLYFRFANTRGIADDALAMGLDTFLPVAGHFGRLRQPVSASLSDAPAELEQAVSGLYLMRAAAPAIPSGLRTHLIDLDRAPRSAALTGTATLGTLRGAEVAIVQIGDDVVLAAKARGKWAIVGARLSSLGAQPWYGASPRLVLVLGTDAKAPDDRVRKNSDSIHILSAVADAGTGVIVGIPRDTFVNAPYGRDKLAITSRDKGTGQPFGPETTLAAVRDLTGLPIEGYVTTGFTRFTSLVDGFGGFVANLVYRVERDGPTLHPGPNILDGSDALRTARERAIYPSGDVDRQLNHGLLMQGALAKFKADGIAALLGHLKLLEAAVVTDLDGADLLTLGAAALELDDVANIVVEGDVVFETIRGEVVFGFGLTPSNLTTFADLADGIISPGLCAVTFDPEAPLPPCWTRP